MQQKHYTNCINLDGANFYLLETNLRTSACLVIFHLDLDLNINIKIKININTNHHINLINKFILA
jgi:hypothetical protein